MAVVEDKDGNEIELNMIQRWPVKQPITFFKHKPRPYKLLETGVRTIDTLNPIVEGGTGFIPGAFGTGKTVLQHAISKQAESDIVIIAACGERANEVVEIFTEFPELEDPHTGRKLMERTIIIANTSNMPVAAREASVYTAMTIGEYYRAMGLKVLLMADSTSRWAQALREMSSRLEEMPGEEGYPAYLSSRLAEFYERAGLVEPIGSPKGTEGAVSVIGAVSPPGGDTSEPVSQATLRIVKVFWGLSASLAHRRHFPAIDWLRSYSQYDNQVGDYFNTHVHSNWTKEVKTIKRLLQDEAELEEIVRLVGVDSLGIEDRVKLLTAQMVREDFLHQNAFHDIDTYTSSNKQYYMIRAILVWHEKALIALKNGHLFKDIENSSSKNVIGRFKYTLEEDVLKEFNNINKLIDDEFEIKEEK